MAKEILYGKDAREKIKAGIDKVANAIAPTGGPKGRNALLDTRFNAVIKTNDGATIANNFELSDPFENMGVKLMKEVTKTSDKEAGDGTTTTSILTQELTTRALNLIDIGLNPINVNKGIELAKDLVTKELEKNSKKVSGKDLEKVATTSVESKELGTLIASLVSEIGEDGVVTIETSNIPGVTVSKTEGFEISRGVPGLESMELNNPRILVTDHKISSLDDIRVVDDLLLTGKKELLIISESLEGQAIQVLADNQRNGFIRLVPIKAPEFGEYKKKILEDIAILTGATFISSEFMEMSEVTLDMLGSAKKVKANESKTTILGGRGDNQEIFNRLVTLKRQIKNEKVDYEKELLKKRLARLSGSVAVITVGHVLEEEVLYLKHKVEDAVNACQSALEEGIVVGGGAALVHASKVDCKEENTEVRAGFNALIESVRKPLKQIVVNEGVKSAEVVLEKVLENGVLAGYDALNGVYEKDMFKAGIIDPLKVVKSALKNSTSIACTLNTTEFASTEIWTL